MGSDRRIPVPLLRVLLLILLLPGVADAVEPARVDDPDAGLRVRIDQVLDRAQVGDATLRDTLGALALGHCLSGIEPELTAGLDALRVVHVAAVERKSYSRAWSLWERALDGLSTDAFQLVTTWLDSPETARRLYLCDDDLPVSWRGVDAPAYVREALGWFDAGGEQGGRACPPASVRTDIVRGRTVQTSVRAPRWLAFPEENYAVVGTGDDARLRWTPGPELAHWFRTEGLVLESDPMPEAEARALDAVKSAQKLSLVHLPNRPGPVLQANPVLDATEAAPRFTDSWSDMRVRLETFIRSRRLPGNQVVIIGDAPLESEWMAAAKAAGYLQANEYFGSQVG